MKKLFSISLIFFALISSAQTIKQKQVDGLGDSLRKKVDTSSLVKVDTTGSLNGDIAYLDKPINTVKFRRALSFNELRFKVGDAGFPVNGDVTYTNDFLINKHVRIWRSGELQDVDNTVYGIEFDETTGEITFYPALSSNEPIYLGISDKYYWSTPAVSTTLTFSSPLTETSGVWQGTGAGFNSDVSFANQVLHNGDDGIAYAQFQTNSPEHFFGFCESPYFATYASIGAGFFITTGGVVYKVDGGGFSFQGYTLTANEYYGVRRTGSTWDLVVSTDASTWTSIITLTWAVTAEVHCQLNMAAGSHFHLPKGQNLY